MTDMHVDGRQYMPPAQHAHCLKYIHVTAQLIMNSWQSCRLTQSMLQVAKKLAKVRAAHKQHLQKMVTGLTGDPQFMVQL